MTADTRPGIKGHVAKRLGGGSVDYLPDAYIHLMTKLSQLIHQSDVHAPEDILKNLAHLSHLRTGYWNDDVGYLRVKKLGKLGRSRIYAPDKFRGISDAVVFVPRIDPFRRVSQVEIYTASELGGLQNR